MLTKAISLSMGLMAVSALVEAPSELVAQTVRDSAAIQIISVDLTRPTALVRVSPTPIADIGGGDTQREQLFQVRGIARLSDGGIAVANGGTSQIKLFDRNGRFLFEGGRRGQGPGEFQRMGAVWVLPGDTILIADELLQRIVLFNRSAVHLRTISLTPPLDRREPRVIDLAPGPTLLATSSDVTRLQPRPAPYYFTQELYVYGLDGKPLRSLGNFNNGEYFVQATTLELGRVAYWNLTFGRVTTIRSSGNDVVVGDGTAFELRRFLPSGRLGAIIRAPFVPPAVTVADKAAAHAAAIERATPQDRPVAERRLAEMPYPERFPAFERFEIEPDGRIWVKRYQQPTARVESWWVIAPNGTYLGEVTLPERVVLRAAGRGWIACVGKDADDVEHVLVYSVTLDPVGR